MKRRDEVMVGVVLTVAIIIAIVGTIYLVRGGLSAGYPLYARFTWGGGARQGQPVLLAGANVGYIDDVTLERTGTVFVRMKINKKFSVPEGSTATIVPVGFFGDAALALTPARPTNESIPAGDTVPTGRPAPTINDLIARADSVSLSVSDMTKAVQVELVQGGGVADLRRTLANTNKLVAQLSTIAAEQSRQLSATMTQLRRTASAVDSASVDSTVQSLQASSANLEALTGDLKTTSARVNSLLAKVDSGGGTAGRLVNDPALYDDTRRLLVHVDSLLSDFKKNPKRYVNLSIF